MVEQNFSNGDEMVSNTIHATYMETYDINTIKDELSILAIHTPQSDTLKRFFHGLYEQYSKMKVLGCNFQISCASKQDLDPTLVGFEAGQIDPRDVMNPILFKACTGEGINSLLDQIYNAGEKINPSGSILNASIDQHGSVTSALDAYYSLLADGSYRQSHPQRGMLVQGLKPMVHKVVTTQPFKWNSAGRSDNLDSPLITGSPTGTQNGTSAGFGAQSGSKNFANDPVNPSVFVSDGVTEMPWLDTAFSKIHTYVDGSGVSQGSVKAYSLQQNIPRVYMGALVLPPSAGVQNLYFRITIVWHILFKDFRFAQDLLPVTAPGPIDTDSDSLEGTGLDAMNGYFNMYHSASKLTKDYGSFDTQGVESVKEVIQKGM